MGKKGLFELEVNYNMGKKKKKKRKEKMNKKIVTPGLWLQP